jgi:hypothetical protein
VSDWIDDRVTDLTNPFILRRDGLDVITVGGGSGTGGRTVTFSQAAGAPAIIGGSPKFIAPFSGTISRVTLSVVSGPQGSSLTVQLLKNAVVFSTLQVFDGTTTTQIITDGLPVIAANDELTVNAVTVGSNVAAQGVTVTMELGS